MNMAIQCGTDNFRAVVNPKHTKAYRDLAMIIDGCLGLPNP